MTMMLRQWFTAVFLGSLVKIASTQCLSSLGDVLRNENTVTDVRVPREYVLCPNMVYEPGVVDNNGDISGGDLPLVCKSNVHIKCGDDGRSENMCVIDGTGSFAIYILPLFLFGADYIEADNITVQGITIDFFVQQGQIPVLAGATAGVIRFIDCIFSNNNADPLFLMDEFIPGAASATARTATLGDGSDSENLGFTYPKREELSYIGRRLEEVPQEEQGNVTVRDTRVLQRTGAFRVEFTGCTFDTNDPVRNTMTQNGLSVLRFRGADPENPFDQLGLMDARLTRNTFIDNTYFFREDQAVYRSIVDFFSRGRIRLRQNCFINSPVKLYSTITAQQDANVVNDRNFLDPVQTGLSCDFITFLDFDYRFVRCGPKATAPRCRADAPSNAPTPFPAPSPPTGPSFCFPGRATVHVEGKGAVPVKDVKLGDKVLAGTGKYESVYSFGHYNEEIEAQYLKINTAAGSLELSKDHMVFIHGGQAIPASMLATGDNLELADGNPSHVRDIQEITREGAFAPFTKSGTVVVDGFKASSFIAYQDSATLRISRIDTGLTFQFLALTFEGPHRIWCQYFSACQNEKYSREGISSWVYYPHLLVRWYLDQSEILMMMLGVPLVGFFVILARPLAFLLAVGVILKVALRPSRLCKLKSA